MNGNELIEIKDLLEEIIEKCRIPTETLLKIKTVHERLWSEIDQLDEHLTECEKLSKPENNNKLIIGEHGEYIENGEYK